MEKFVLENEELYVEINSVGAELSRIKNKKNDKEYLWNADEKYWKRHSPVLFPIVGKLKKNQTLIGGRTYELMQHGFARDLDFEPITKLDHFHSYVLKSNKYIPLYNLSYIIHIVLRKINLLQYIE